MNGLDQTQQRILTECLRALDQGADIDDCLARYPGHADALRPYLELRARLLVIEKPAAPASAFEAGRQALLERLAGATPTTTDVPLLDQLGRLFAAWRVLPSPLVRVAAAGALLVVLAGGALGASAAAGVDPARDVLSALPFVEPSGGPEEAASPNAQEGLGNADDGIGNAPAAATPDQGPADDNAAQGGGNGLDNATENANCVPQEVLDRLPLLTQLLDDHPVCPTGEAGDGQPGQSNQPPHPTMTPPGGPP